MKKKLVFSLLMITLTFSGCESSKTSTSDIPKSSSEVTTGLTVDDQEELELEEDDFPNTSDNNTNETSGEPEEETADSSISIEPIYEEGSLEKELQDYAVKIITENYTYTDIESLTVNENLGTEEDGDYIILARLTWNQKNKASTSQDMLSMYSSDFAARIGMDQPSVNEVAIFWTVPYLNNANAKWSYERNDDGMYLSDNMMDSVFDQ
ncbi:MAG: hypothetical protein HFI45_14675 [Lachnospiraceae bacterium]|nr:hypothetical protein [Lachnospiraceae bacterium]